MPITLRPFFFPTMYSNMADSDNATGAPHTPIRPTIQVTREQTTAEDNSQSTNPANTGPPSPVRRHSTPTTGTAPISTEELNQLRTQLLRANAQITALQTRISTTSTLTIDARPHQSREYWMVPIDKSIRYPGEDSHQAARTVYKQRLRAYLCKSPPIHALITGAFPCPITTITNVVALLRTSFGANWEFKPKHIKRALTVLKHLDTATHQTVTAAMDAESNTQTGSWNQRNTAIQCCMRHT